MISAKNLVCIMIGIIIGIVVSYLLKIGIVGLSEQFANKKAMAQEINEKVGDMFNQRTESYDKIKKEIDYYDAVMYGNMKKLRNKQGFVDAPSIEAVI